MISQALNALISKCLVQVRAPGRFATGFFVSRSTVITCAAALRDVHEVTVSWGVLELSGKVTTRVHQDGLDIAVVELAVPVDHPSVWLADPPKRLRDGAALTAYGFTADTPETRPDLCSLVLTPSADSDCVLLAESVPSGMSGSPVVDRHSRQVTGIVLTGDRIVTAEVLTRQVPNLVEANRRDCVAWRDTVDPGLGHLLELSTKDNPPVVEFESERTPFYYLEPRRRVVGFLHRPERELEKLEEWCRPGSSQCVRLIYGPGGAGKTRLAVELIDKVRGKPGWTALRLANPADADLGTLAKSLDGRRVLLCLEDAEEWAYDLPDMLAKVRDRSGLRILLLARTDGRWWTRLCTAGGDLVNAEQLLLAPLGRKIDPATIVRQAYQDFRTELAPSAPEQAPPALVDAALRQVHALELLAGVLAVVLHCRDHEGEPPDGPIDLQHTLKGVLGHERRWWESWIRHADQNDVQADAEILEKGDFSSRLLLMPAVYVATDSRQADDAIQAAFAGQGFGAGLSARAAAALAKVYPPTPGGDVPRLWDPLRPDRLGETLVLEVLKDDQADLADLLCRIFATGVDQVQAERVLTVLGRAESATDDEDLRHRVRACVRALLERYAGVFFPAAISVALTLTDPTSLIDAIEATSGSANDEALRNAVLDIPEDNTKLASLAAKLWERRCTLLLEQSKNLATTQRLTLAQFTQWQAYAHDKAEETQLALEVAGRAIDHYRQVVAAGKAGEQPTMLKMREFAAEMAKKGGLYEEALAHSRYASDAYFDIEDYGGLQQTMKFQGELLRELGRDAQAEEAFKEAKKYGLAYKKEIDELVAAQIIIPDDTPDQLDPVLAYQGPKARYDDPDVRLVIPVGHFAGPMYTAPGAAAPESFEIRFRDGVFSLSAGEYAVWATSHGDPNLVSRIPTTRAVAEYASKQAGVLEPAIVSGQLLDDGLLVEIGLTAESTREFARNHRVVPLALGLGNSARNPAEFAIGLPNAARVSVGYDVYHLWLFSHRAPTLWDAITAIAQEAAESNDEEQDERARLVDDPDALLAGLVRALQVLISTSCVFIDRV
ncbi:trypsin-like peptidase domain-containing protein [Amycolatopsis sp. lyj-112]|uniref:trypsin-like peptidase domain-containing protein n=1 Tax=Amycolatopsis sp. lyj-112 TaxID=2789288 RepID=UPI00397BCAF9